MKLRTETDAGHGARGGEGTEVDGEEGTGCIGNAVKERPGERGCGLERTFWVRIRNPIPLVWSWQDLSDGAVASPATYPLEPMDSNLLIFTLNLTN